MNDLQTAWDITRKSAKWWWLTVLCAGMLNNLTPNAHPGSYMILAVPGMFFYVKTVMAVYQAAKLTDKGHVAWPIFISLIFLVYWVFYFNVKKSAHKAGLAYSSPDTEPVETDGA